MTSWDDKLARYWPPVVGRVYFGQRHVVALEPYQKLVHWYKGSGRGRGHYRAWAGTWVRWCAAQERKGVPMFEEQT